MLAPFLIEAQAPVAAFTANVTTGCSPLSVNFTDQSTGGPSAWNWDFGNGQLSNQKNASVTFVAPGSTPVTYTISLVVRNANGIDQVVKTAYITVNPSPTAGLVVDRTLACLPASVNFTDKSVANAGTINKWEWDFGDGTRSNAQNPSHTYTAPGFYDIYMQVTSTTGCYGAIGLGRYIRMVNGVKADFSTTGPSTCQSPFNILFNNLTSGPGVLTYTWDLGNATTSTAASPTASYPSANTYNIKMVVKSEFGCSDSVQKPIMVNGIATSFTTSTGKDTVCLGSPVTFQSTSSITPTKNVWDFGDGTSSSVLTPPAKIYASPGIYHVKLSSTFSACADSAKRDIYVYDKPVVDFTADKSGTCKPPLVVNFTNTSPDAVKASDLWTFGDGATGNAPNHTYTVQDKIFDVTLAITDSKGCKNSLTKPQFVRILTPLINIQNNSPTGVCVGKPYIPVRLDVAAEGFASYSWDFGDGTAVDAAANPSHIYATAGKYTVKVTGITNGGCTAIGTTTVQVGDAPVIDFKADKTDYCLKEPVTFTNLSTPATITSFEWNFKDGSQHSFLKDPPPHTFIDTGFQSVQLKVTSNGCTDSVSKTIVRILPPVANFGFQTKDCANRTTVTFTDSSSTSPSYPPITYEWSFGDPSNTQSSVIGNTTFTYPTLTGAVRR